MDEIDRKSKSKLSKTSGKGGRRKNATMTQTSKLGKKEVSCTLQFETDKIPDAASAEMFTAIFKAAKTFGTALSKEDLERVDEDTEKFWGKSNVSSEVVREKPKKNIKPKAIVEQEDDLDTSLDALLKEADALLGRNTDDLVQKRKSDPDPASPSDKNKKNKVCTNMLIETTKLEEDSIVLSDNDDGDDIPPRTRSTRKLTVSKLSKRTPKKGSPNQKGKLKNESKSEDSALVLLSSDSEDVEELNLGNVLFFQVVLMNKRYPIRIYDNQFVRDLRKMVAQKSGLQEEGIQMFFGDYLLLEDNLTVKECGLENLCDVDAYYKQQSDQELFEAGSTSILRFKLQTCDRRGRQDSYVYINKNSPMQSVRDKYAEEKGLDASRLKLMFDGECLNLSGSPADCDLDGEECIDVILSA